jgi:hypothetical protein
MTQRPARRAYDLYDAHQRLTGREGATKHGLSVATVYTPLAHSCDASRLPGVVVIANRPA